jgi:hypothetical protein
MDFGVEVLGEPQRVFSHSENVCLDKSEIKKGAKSVNPCCTRPVARDAGNKKPQLITVGVWWWGGTRVQFPLSQLNKSVKHCV